MLHDVLVCCHIHDLDACTGQRHGFTSLRVLLDDFDRGFYLRVLNVIAEGLALRGNHHAEIADKLRPGSTFHLVEGIVAVGELLCFGVPVRVGGEVVALALPGRVPGARLRQIDLELRTGLRLFDLIVPHTRRASIKEFVDLHLAFDDLLVDRGLDRVIFHGKLARLRAHGIDGAVQIIPRCRGDLPDRPAVVTGIRRGAELAAVGRCHTLHQVAVMVQAIDRAV